MKREEEVREVGGRVQGVGGSAGGADEAGDGGGAGSHAEELGLIPGNSRGWTR